MTEIKKTSSVFFRTVLSLTVCTIIVFAILCLIYYQQMSKSIISDQKTSLYQAVKDTSDGYHMINADSSIDESERSTVFGTYFHALAAADQIHIWVVDSVGRITSYTDIPGEVIGQLKYDGSVYSMTRTQLQGLTDSTEGGVVTGTQNGLFSDPSHVWLSAAYPLTYSGDFLIIHKSIDVQQETMWMLSNGLAVPVIISFAVALFLFILMTRSLVNPIRLLSDVARKVTKGDLTARIHVPEIEKESPVKYVIADELSEMITSVNQMIERLEAQENDRRVFISSIAHDLRTPLTSIKGFLAAMLDGTIPPEKFEHYLKITKTEVDRIQTLTTAMTEASTLGKKDTLKPKMFDINDLIRETLTSMEKLLQDKKLGVQLETYKDDDGTLMTVADRAAIMRVVYNLLFNAIKFTPEDGELAVTTDYSAQSGQVIVTVEDSGPGIPKDKRKRIFDSFYKIDESRTNPGSGLGLYICKEILLAHDQMIYVDDSPILGGARFKFTLQGTRNAE